MVGGLVKKQQVGIVYQYTAQSDLFLLATAERLQRLVQFVVQFQPAQNFFYALFKRPFIFMFGPLCGIDKIPYTLMGEHYRLLRQVSHAGLAAEGHPSAVLQRFVGEDIQQGRLAIPVAGNESGLLSGIDAEGDVLEQYLVAKRLGKILNRKQRRSHNSQYPYFCPQWARS